MEDKRKTVYEVLKNKTGYKDSFEDFNKIIENDEKARTKVYEVLKNKTGYKDSFDDFNKFLGVGMTPSSSVKQTEIPQTVLPSSPVGTDIPGNDHSYTDQQYDVWSKLTPDARKTLIGSSSFYDEVEKRISDDRLLENAGLGTKIYPDSVVSGGVAFPGDPEMAAERNFRNEIRGQLNQQIEEGKKEANTQLGEVYNKDFDKKMKFQRDHPFLSSLMDMSSGMKFSRSGIDTASPRYTNEEAKNLHATANKLDDAQDVLDESVRKGKTNFFGGLLRGLGKKVFDLSTWDAGATDMLDTSALFTAATDKEAGKQLSHSQNLLLDAAAVDMAVDENFAGDLGRGYKAGQVTAESVPFMLEFIINPASGLGETATKSIVKRGIQKYGKDAMKTTIKKIEMNAVRAATDLAGAGIMSATTGSGRVVADTQNRMIGDVQYGYDENGYIRYTGTEGGDSLGTSLAKAYGANVIENYSEMLGNYFSPFTDAITGVASRGLEKIGLSKVNRFIGEIKASDWGRVITDFEKRTQWHGNLGEYAEEVAGGTLNALFIGDQTLDTDPNTGVFNLDNNIDTLLGVSMMGGFLSGVRTFGYRTPKYKARKSLEKADREAENVFGDGWKDLKSDIEGADENNIASVLSAIYQSDEYKPEQKEAAIIYASSLKNYQGANLADLRRKTDGDVNEIQLQTENSYDNGYGLSTPEERNDAKIALEGAIGTIMDSHPNMTEEDVISTINSYGNTPSEILMQLSRSEINDSSLQYISQVTDYLNAKAQYDGMIDNVRDGMEGEIETQMAYITKNTHSDGNVYNATMKVDDRRVYVIGGNIAIGEDGVINHQQSDKSIVIRDAQTGDLEMVDAAYIQSMQPGVNAEQHKAQISEQIKQDYVDKAAAEINGVLPFNPGDTYNILNAETGAREELVIQQVEGDLVTVSGVDGKEVQTTKEEIQELVNRERMLRFKEQYQQEILSRRPTGKKILDDGRIISATSANESEVVFDVLDQTGNIVDSDVMSRDEYDSLREIESGSESEVELGDDGLPVIAETNVPLSENPVIPEQDIIEEKDADGNRSQIPVVPLQETGIIPAKEETAQKMQEDDVSTQKGMDESPVIPVDEKGNLQYHKAPVEMTIEDITSPVEMDGEVYNPTEEEVTGIISANKDEAIKLYEKLNSKPPKIGANKKKYFAEKKQWNEQVADAKKQVNYWNEVETHVKTLYEKPGDTTVNEIKAMGEPMNGEELAAMMLGAGKLPLLYGEYKRETGFGNTDAKKMFGLFASKEKGGMTIEQAGEQLMLADLEAGTNFFDQNDPNVGRNAIIDVLSSARTRGGLINYIKSNREAMAKRERQAEVEADESAKEQWYQDNYHMTPEEYELWDQGELFAESNVISDEEYQEFMSNFVDEILNEQENDRRTPQESGSSIAESESNEQEGVSGVREPGSPVLQGEESVPAGTTGRIEEESGQVDANSGAEYDALQSSPSGRELTSSSRSQENVPETYMPSRMEGESLLDYASRVNDAHLLHQEEQKVDTNPTEAQKEAGNYKKGHIKVDGFDITIENPRGSERSGVNADGKPWSVIMNNTYGYIRGTEGVDGDHIDVFLGNSGNGVYVVDQVKEDGSFDEHKVMYGFASLDEAKEAYLSNYSPGWKGLGNITGVSKELFKEWIDSSHRKTKPFAEYKVVQDHAEIKTDDPVQNENNIRFREVKEKDGSKSLVGLHNISGDKLRKALKLGGFANPSAAVIDIDRQSHEGYGEISLVLPSTMVAKSTGRNAGTFSGDAWTPTYPQIERQFIEEGSKRVYDDISKLPQEMQPDVRSAWNSYMDGRDANAFAYQFLYEKGETPELRKIEPVFSEDIRKKITGVDAIDDYDNRNAAILEAYIDEKFDGDRAKFEEYIETRKRVLQKKIDEAPSQKGFVYRRAVENLKDIEDNGYEYDSVKRFYDEVMSDIRKSGGIDTYQTMHDVQEKISQSAELSKEYDEWKENLMDKYGIKEVLFKGYTPSGNRVYLPHTLENVAKMMRQQGLAGATGWGGSFSKFAAGLMKPVGTLDGIRRQKRKLTTNHEDIEAFREKWERVYFDLGLKLNPGATAFDDTGLYRVEEIATKSNSRSFAKREYGVELSDEDVRQLNDMVTAIRNEYPAMYFETKFERPVYLNEFAAAVVPDNASEEIVDAMNEAGMKVFTYKTGDDASRNEAVEDASHIDGVRFREDSMKTYHGSGAEFDKFNLAHSGKGEGESMIGKGIYTTQDKRIAEEYAGVAGNREVAGKKHLYEVEIPADNGGNYLDYDKVYDAAEMSEITGRLHDAGVDIDFNQYFHGGKASGKNLYTAMTWNMPEGAEVNQVLSDAGYVGYKYSTRHDLGGKKKRFPKKSYVVFDESNATITGHEQIVSEIERISDTLHTPVKIARSLDELPEGAARQAIQKGRNVKGWFDTKTGEVVIYLPNATGEEDAKATFLHEIVGHKGLRTLLGEKAYDDEMVKLYGQLPIDARKLVADAAVRDYGANVAIAMDEYLAEQAEKDEAPSWWNKVVSAIRDLLRRVGVDVVLSANDVKYLLWRSRKNLEQGNVLDVAEDVAMRKKNYVGEYSRTREQEKDDYKKTVGIANKFADKYAGSAPIVVIQSKNTIYEQLIKLEISEKDIRDLEDMIDSNVALAVYHPEKDVVVILNTNASEKDINNYLWHENAHRAIRSVFGDRMGEAVNPVYEWLYKKDQEVCDRIKNVYHDRSISEQKEECVVRYFEDMFSKKGEVELAKMIDEASLSVKPFFKQLFNFIVYGAEKNDPGTGRSELLVRRPDVGRSFGRSSQESGERKKGYVGKTNMDMRNSEDGGKSAETGRGRAEADGGDFSEKRLKTYRFREEGLFGEQSKEDSGQNNSLLDAYKKRIFELNSRINSLERKIDTYTSAEELSSEVFEEIKKEISSDIVSEIGKGELNSLLLQVKNARTKKSLEKIFMNVKRIALSAQSRKLQRMMDKLLALKVQDVNGKNMSIAKNVDDSTRRIFSFIRGKLSDIKKSGLEDDILYLKRDNRKHQEEIRRLERTIQDTNDVSIKDEAMASIDQSRKTIEENKERIQELRDEKNEIEKQIAASSDIDVEKEMSALNEKMDRAAQGETVWSQGDSERMAALNIISGQIMNKSHDFEIRSIELDIQQRLLNNSNLYKDRMKEPSENKRRQITNTINENRRQVVALERLINDTRAMQVKQLQMTIEQLEELISNGKNSLLRRTEEEVKRKSQLIGMAIKTIDGKPVDIYDKKSTEEGVLKKFFSAPLGSFEYMCKRVNTKTLGKDGFLYKYFVEGKDGVMKAYDTYVLGMEELRGRLDNKSKEIFGERYDNVWTLSDKTVNNSGVHIVDTKSKIDGGYGVKYEIPLSKGQAMYIYQVWKMNDGRTKLEMQGFDEESIVEIRDFIGNDYIKFADWIQEELLPELREKYNTKYLEMYGTSLVDIKDYIPLRIVKKSTRQESDLSEDKERKKTLEERAGSLINRVVNTRPVDITMNAFDVLFDHGRQMEEWNAYARVRRDLDAVLSNTTFRNQLDANTRGSFHNFYDAAAVATKTYHPDQNKFMDEVLGKLSKGIVGGNIAWRLSTALKQVLSAPAFWGYSQSPGYMKSLLTNAVKIPATYKWCMENIPSFRERVSQGTAGNEKLDDKSFSKYLDKYIETGMIPNKFVDAVTCSIGAKSIYEYRYGQLIKQGLVEDEARNQALMDADIYYNQTQQSSHPVFLSPMQMSRSIMDRMITTYQNSNIGYVRKVLAAYYDLTRSLKWKELKKNYTDMYMQEGMDEVEASSRAYRRLLNENKKTVFETVLFAWGMNLLWNIGSKGLLGLFVGDGDDDDNDLAKGISFFLTSPIKGMPGGNLLESIASGYGMNPILVYDELDKFMKEAKFAIDEYGLISPEIAFSTMEKVSRYGGVDLEVLGNIYLGVEGLARDGALSDDKTIDFMYMLNSPKSNRAAVAKELYKDESVVSFAEKVARANKYITKHDSWEGWVPGAKDLTKRRKKDLEKEYERLHMTEDEKKSSDEKKIADKHRRKLKELNDDPFALADYIVSHKKEHKIYRKYY